ncbi:hypothetical protein [Nitratireductor sp. CH_MIT9313-5]|uniref:hypothetical protein n=1 Tax=Nitratireductor sp. CH_MIT9313-5 TaxID=3107764 RepID=UPI00300B5956
MNISFIEQRSDFSLTASKTGDVLTLNGEAFDFSPLPEGGTINGGDIPSDWIVGNVTRVNGAINLTLILPYGPNPTDEVLSPQPIIVTADGPIALPGGGNVEA